jgi:hypothetical protein
MNEVSFASKVFGSDDSFESSAGPAAGLEDAAEFRQLLQARPQVPEAGSHSVGSMLDHVTRSMREHEHQVDKSLKRAGKTADPVEFLNLSKHLSETYLTHSLAVKVISKTTQALEGLTKLQ